MIPRKAKALLQEAGYPQGFEFTVYLFTLPGLPEQVDIGQAIALDWQAVGLKPKLVEVDFPRVREQYRTKTIHGAAVAWTQCPAGPGLHSYFQQEQRWRWSILSSIPTLTNVSTRSARRWTPANGRGCCKKSVTISSPNLPKCRCSGCSREAVVNPKYIAEYVFPGVITGFFTHLEYVKLVQ